MHPKPAAGPFAFFIAVSAAAKVALEFTAFCRFALHVRPSAVHFLLQLSPAASAFTQRTKSCTVCGPAP